MNIWYLVALSKRYMRDPGHLVRRIAQRKDDTAILTNVCTILVLCDELEAQCIAAGADSIRFGVVGTLQDAVARALRLAAAVLVNPLVSIVAVVVAVRVVEPSPIGVNDNFSLDIRAATLGRAFLPAHLRVRLGLLATGLLSDRRPEQGQQGETEHGNGAAK